MECFYHPGGAAVAVCKSCGRGLCRLCAVDIGRGMACRGRCEEDARALTSMIERNMLNRSRLETVAKLNYRNRFNAALFYLVFGAFSLGFACYRHDRFPQQSADLFAGGMGVLFLAYGLFLIQRTKKYPKLANDKEKT